jgi:hypothetical protein
MAEIIDAVVAAISGALLTKKLSAGKSTDIRRAGTGKIRMAVALRRKCALVGPLITVGENGIDEADAISGEIPGVGAVTAGRAIPGRTDE